VKLHCQHILAGSEVRFTNSNVDIKGAGEDGLITGSNGEARSRQYEWDFEDEE
jgi:hypothetical protein